MYFSAREDFTREEMANAGTTPNSGLITDLLPPSNWLTECTHYEQRLVIQRIGTC